MEMIHYFKDRLNVSEWPEKLLEYWGGDVWVWNFSKEKEKARITGLCFYQYQDVILIIFETFYRHFKKLFHRSNFN